MATKREQELLKALKETVEECRSYISCDRTCKGCENRCDNNGFCRIPHWEKIIRAKNHNPNPRKEPKR